LQKGLKNSLLKILKSATYDREKFYLGLIKKATSNVGQLNVFICVGEACPAISTTDNTLARRRVWDIWRRLLTSSPFAVKLSWQHSNISIFYDDL